MFDKLMPPGFFDKFTSLMDSIQMKVVQFEQSLQRIESRLQSIEDMLNDGFEEPARDFPRLENGHIVRKD